MNLERCHDTAEKPIKPICHTDHILQNRPNAKHWADFGRITFGPKVIHQSATTLQPVKSFVT